MIERVTNVASSNVVSLAGGRAEMTDIVYTEEYRVAPGAIFLLLFAVAVIGVLVWVKRARQPKSN